MGEDGGDHDRLAICSLFLTGSKVAAADTSC